MSENKTLTPLEVVERYHQRYLEYETAFNNDPFSDKDLRDKLDEIVKSNIDTESEEFLDKMVDIVVEKPQRRVEVNNAALKFSLFVDFYLLTQEEDLPDNIMEDYNSLPIKDSLKSFFSVKDGKFVRNEKQEVSPDMKKYFKDIVFQLKQQTG